jgi:peptide/nickel transport system substrate-binding protein
MGAANPDILYGFTGFDSGIICPSDLANPDQMTATPIGSGPYVIKSAVPGDAMTMQLRKEWKWGPDGVTADTPGLPQQIVFKIVTNTTTAANLLTSGGLDVAAINGPDVQRLQATKSLRQVVNKSYGADLIGFNHQPGYATADEAVREALMTAVDTDAYNRAATAGLADLATSYLSSDVLCYDPKTAAMMPKGGPERAKSILTNAGYTMSPSGFMEKDGKPLAIALTTSNAFAFGSGAEYIVNQWIAAGVDATVNSSDLAAYNIQMRGLTFQTMMMPFGQTGGGRPVPFGQVGIAFGPLPSEGGRNLTSVRDPVIDAAIDAAFQASTSADSCAQWAIVQERALEKHHVMPLVSQSVQIFTRGIELQELTMPWTYRRVS